MDQVDAFPLRKQAVSMKKRLGLLAVVLAVAATSGAAYYLTLPNAEQAVNQDNKGNRVLIEAARKMPVGIEAIELTPQVARLALLHRIRSSRAGPLDIIDAEKISAASIKVDQSGKRAECGPFIVLIDKRLYYVGIRDPIREDGHVLDFKGEFERENGRWFATEPSNAP